MEKVDVSTERRVRAQALVLVSMLIVAGSIAMMPTAIAGNGSGDVTFDLFEPHAIYGYVWDGSMAPMNGMDITVVNDRTNEYLEATTDALGRYDVGLAGLTTGYLNGDLISVYMVGGYNTTNVDVLFPAQRVDIHLDLTLPEIGATTVDKLFINSQGTFGGIAPPVMVTVDYVTDANGIAAAAWGIRNDLQVGNSTMYFTCDITNEAGASTYAWPGTWYFINNVLVTAVISPFNAPAGDLFVFGEVNGTSTDEQIIGDVLPTHYATFLPGGTFQAVYSTEGTLDYSDDVVVTPGGTFRAYRYDEGAGYVATAAVSTYTAGDWVNLAIAPIVDGRYAVCVTAVDNAQNANWTNETTGNPVITVDNYPAQATATGPITSNVHAFDLTYNFTADPLPSSGLVNITLYYNKNSTGWETYGTDPAPGDGLFPVDLSVLGDGNYSWCMVAYDNADNREDAAIAEETFTIVDTVLPHIGNTTVDKLFINSQGTFGGIAPPVMVTTEVYDDNLAVAGWGIRNDLQIGNATMYFTVDVTNDVMPTTHGWDGTWYFIEGALVTASMSPATFGTDLYVFGEVNGTSAPEDRIGNVLPSHYANFDMFGNFQAVYSTEGTLDNSDDVQVIPAAGDTFHAYRYDEGAGMVATAAVSTYTAGDWVILTIAPIVDGRYAVCVTAVDWAENAYWTNETRGPNPVITVDNFPPEATATGPLTSQVAVFDVTYDFTADPLPSSGLLNITLYYNKDSAGWETYGTDPAPGDGLFPVDVSGLGGDGVYEWYMVAYDNTNNHMPITWTAQATTLVDGVAPNIGPTTADKLYINNQGTFGGIAPPVMVTTNVTDTNLAAAAWAVRDFQVWEGTMYFSVDITNEPMPATYGWDGSWYHLDGALVTAGISPFFAPGGDLFVFGEVNGTSNPEDRLGNVLPTHYVTFMPNGIFQAVYSTEGTLDYSDDVMVTPTPGDTFTAYRYDEGYGYVATAAVYTFTVNPWVSDLTISPVPDGQYAVCVSAIDWAQNAAWTNETTGNPVITVDNFPPVATATGPITSNVHVFDLTYNFTADPLPSSELLNVTLFYNKDAAGWNVYGIDPTPGDGLFPVDVSGLGGDGVYEWYMVAYDNTNNHMPITWTAQATTLVDGVAPNIGPTTVDKQYINNQGTFGGIAPPVMVTTNVTDDNLLAASIGIRNEDTGSQPNNTFYVTYAFNHTGPATWNWDGQWHFIGTELITLVHTDPWFPEMAVMGELDGSHITGEILGRRHVPSHYALWDGLGWTFYESMGTLDPSDDNLVVPNPIGVFKPYRYDDGIGYIVGSEYMDPANTMVLNSYPIPDGRYTVVVGATDQAENWIMTGEADGNPVITVDTVQPIITVEMALTGDVSGNGFINTGDTITIWVNVTDLNEDATTVPSIDVDELLLPNQPVSGLIYLGLGVWECTYVVQGPEFTVSNIDASFRDLANNLVDAPDVVTFEIHGSFTLTYTAGWNLFGIPVLNPTIGGAPLASASDLAAQGASMVSKWDFATQRYVNFIAGFHLPGEPRDFAFEEDQAYWAWFPGDVNLNVEGKNPGPRNLAVDGPGWNMVAYMDPVNIGDVETDWAPYVSWGALDDIAYYNGTTFIHYIFPGDVMQLVPGRGYFVWNDAPAVIPYGGGAYTGPDGTIGNPFLVKNAWDLQNMNLNLTAHYALANDIDAGITSGWNGGEGFVPIGPGPWDQPANHFTGTFDGRGYEIANLYINRSTTMYVGLFGILNGSAIENLGMINYDFTGYQWVGGIAGLLSDGTISNVYSTGSLTAMNEYAYSGGLVGSTRSGSMITDSFASVTVSGHNNLGHYLGGLVGSMADSSISRCYATGTVNGENRIGGLVGCPYGASTITDSYATGSVTGGSSVGGLIGQIEVGGVNVTNSYATGAVSGTGKYIGGFAGRNLGTINGCFYDTETTGRSDTGKGTPRTTAQMKTQSTFVGWDFTNIWYINEGVDYPRLSWT